MTPRKSNFTSPWKNQICLIFFTKFSFISLTQWFFYDGNSLILFTYTHILIHNCWKTISTKKLYFDDVSKNENWKLNVCAMTHFHVRYTHLNVEIFHQHKLSNRKIKTVFFLPSKCSKNCLWISSKRGVRDQTGKYFEIEMMKNNKFVLCAEQD